MNERAIRECQLRRRLFSLGAIGVGGASASDGLMMLATLIEEYLAAKDAVVGFGTPEPGDDIAVRCHEGLLARVGLIEDALRAVVA